MTDVPILLLGYNRPELLAERIQELRSIAPPLIYISVDGSNDLIENQINQQLLLNLRDWPKTSLVVTWRHKENLGLTNHVTSAISRVLTEHSNVIVVEDDILLSPSFYTNMINGFHVLNRNGIRGTVGAFSPLRLPRKIERLNRWRKTPYFSCWGWGVSREVWEKYEVDLRKENIEMSLSTSRTWRRLSRTQKKVWMKRFEKAFLYPLDTWDVQVQYMSFKYDYVNILPISRFIDNIGFSDNRSTHTKGDKPRWIRSGGYSTEEIKSKSISILSKSIVLLIDSNTFVGDTKLFQSWRSR
jgi:hypothetical protein